MGWVNHGRCGWVLAIAISIVGTQGCGGQTAPAPNASHVTDCRGATEAVPSPPPPGPGVSYVSITVDGELRDYMLYVAPTLDRSRPIPLVIMFHGSPIDAAGMEDLIHFDAEADKGRFLAAWPNGCDGLWSYADGGSKIADEDFVQKMIKQLEARYSIDQARVFLAGLSSGTWMEYRLACDLAGMITGVASIAGTMRLSDDCRPSRPVSILEMHGTLDDVHPWQGGGPHNAFPVDAVLAKWTSLDGCTGTPAMTRTGITVTSIWSHCRGGSVVRLDKVVGGKHTWFGAQSPDAVPGEPDTNTSIWSFFNSLQPTG